jgi:hypothetical protein
MKRIRIELTPIGDRVMCIPAPVERGLGIVNLDGNELVKSEVTVAGEEWNRSEATVFRHGTGVPKWMKKVAPEGSQVIIAKHTASVHRIPISGKLVEFLLVPSGGILMRKDDVEVEVETVDATEEPERVKAGIVEMFPDRDKTEETN